MMRVPAEVHTKLQELKNHIERPFIWILTRAINNYWQSVIGNRLPKKD